MPITPKQFSETLNKEVSNAINNQCPLDAMILELELAKLMCYERYSYYVKQAQIQQMQLEAEATTSKIITPGGKN